MDNEYQVIFGTGPLGQSVMRELIARGKAIRMVKRVQNQPTSQFPFQVFIHRRLPDEAAQ